MKTESGAQLLLTIPQAATLLAVSVFTVRRMVWRGDLRSVRLGRVVRIRRDDLSAFVDKNTECAGEGRD